MAYFQYKLMMPFAFHFFIVVSANSQFVLVCNKRKMKCIKIEIHKILFLPFRDKSHIFVLHYMISSIFKNGMKSKNEIQLNIQWYNICLLLAFFIAWLIITGTRIFSRRTQKSAEEASSGFQRQKVHSSYSYCYFLVF